MPYIFVDFDSIDSLLLHSHREFDILASLDKRAFGKVFTSLSILVGQRCKLILEIFIGIWQDFCCLLFEHALTLLLNLVLARQESQLIQDEIRRSWIIFQEEVRDLLPRVPRL